MYDKKQKTDQTANNQIIKENETKPVSENEHMSTIGQMKDSNDGLLLQCKRLQLFQCPVKDVQIHLFFDTGHSAYIGVLPKVPLALIAHGIYIIMGYPIRISIENGIAEIAFLEFIGSIKNRLYAVMRLYPIQPSLDCRFKFLR